MGLQESRDNLAPLSFCWWRGVGDPVGFVGLLLVTWKSGRARRAAQSSAKCSGCHSLSLPQSSTAFIWFLFPVKGYYSEHQWESISFSAWLILVPRLPCSTFILCLPLSFTSSRSPLCPPQPALLPLPRCAFTSLPSLSHHPQIPLATFVGLWFKKGMSSWNTTLIYVENRMKKYT